MVKLNSANVREFLKNIPNASTICPAYRMKEFPSYYQSRYTGTYYPKLLYYISEGSFMTRHAGLGGGRNFLHELIDRGFV